MPDLSFSVRHDFRQPLPHTQGYAVFFADGLAEVERGKTCYVPIESILEALQANFA